MSRRLSANQISSWQSGGCRPTFMTFMASKVIEAVVHLAFRATSVAVMIDSSGQTFLF